LDLIHESETADSYSMKPVIRRHCCLFTTNYTVSAKKLFDLPTESETEFGLDNQIPTNVLTQL